MRGFFSWARTVLGLAAWIDRTVHCCFFKMCWWLTGLLGFMMPLEQLPDSYTKYFKRILKVLVDRVLVDHISFFVFRLMLDWFICCVSRHNYWCKQSVPRIQIWRISRSLPGTSRMKGRLVSPWWFVFTMLPYRRILLRTWSGLLYFSVPASCCVSECHEKG